MPARKHKNKSSNNNKNNNKQQPSNQVPPPPPTTTPTTTSSSSSSSTTECPDWLLYPIYEMIDQFENQKALIAITALLQKYPKSQLCRGLKAIVQMRLGHQQEAYDLACEIKNEHPHQLIVLQTLLYTFRPLRKFDDIESMYKQAYTQVPSSDEHAHLLIQAYLRQFKYSDMHSIIVQQKSKTTPKYIFMVALSTYLQSKYSPDADDQAILNQVNYKRLVQFQNSNPLTTFDQVSLFLLIFQLAGKFPTRRMIDQCLAGVPHTNLDRSFFSLEYLRPGSTDLLSACNEILQSNPDNWHAWLKYIECVKLLNIPHPETHQYIQTIQQQCDQRCRGPYLAPIALASQLQIPCDTGFLDLFWTLFGSKPSFYTDIVPYLSTTDISWVMNIPPPKLAGIPKNIVRRSNFHALRRKFDIRSPMQDLVDDYSVAHQLDLDMHLLDTDARLSDPFVLLMVLNILDDTREDGNGRTVACIAILESALVHSPSNAVFKFLLIAMYLDIGTATRALAIYATLDIKHIQLDTHSYHLLDRLNDIGESSHAHGFAAQVMAIYTSNANETPELIVDAFQFQAYSKVDEFIQFFNRLQFSITRAVAVTELWRALVLQALDHDNHLTWVGCVPDTPTLDVDPRQYIYDQRDRSILPKLRSGQYVCRAADPGIHALQSRVAAFHLVRRVLESVVDLATDDLTSRVDQLDKWLDTHALLDGVDTHATSVVAAVVGGFARACIFMHGRLEDSKYQLHAQLHRVLNHLRPEIQHIKDVVHGHQWWGCQFGHISTRISAIIESVVYLHVMCTNVKTPDPNGKTELAWFSCQVRLLILVDLGTVLQLMMERVGSESTRAQLRSACDFAAFVGHHGHTHALVNDVAVDRAMNTIISDWELAITRFRGRVCRLEGMLS